MCWDSGVLSEPPALHQAKLNAVQKCSQSVAFQNLAVVWFQFISAYL